jgi:hypothetical protein
MERLDDDAVALLDEIYVPQEHVVESLLAEDRAGEPPDGGE